MLFPLSYEGLRPTSHRPSEDMRSKFRAPAAGVPGDDRGCQVLVSGCHPARGAHPEHSEQVKRLRWPN